MSLDCLFVHPNASGKVYQSLAKDYSAIEPPIWAAMLANGIRRLNYGVSILDCEAMRLSPEESAQQVKDAKASLVAIVVYGQQPSASTQNMVGASMLCNEIKNLDPSQKVILVGLYPSALPAQTMVDERCDFVAEGEGLYTISALLESRMNTADLSKIPGLWYRDQEGKVVASSAKAERIAQEKLEHELPGMAWDLLPMKQYRTSNWHAFNNNNERQPFAALYTSLGCPFKCSFCCINAPFGGSSFRYWRPEFMIEQFDQIAKMGIKNIKIADELFVLKADHFMRLCELIAERGYDFNIWAYARIDTVKETYLNALKKAGVNWLALGIESGVKTVRTDVVKGRFEDVNIKDIVAMIRKHDINTIGNFIFGLPEDTLETMNQTLQISKEINCEMINFYSCMAYPGSQLHKTALVEGWALPKSYVGFSQHSYECQPLPTKHISAREVLEFRDKAFIEYFSDPNYLNFVRNKFGQGTVDDINNMLKHKLPRRLLETSSQRVETHA